jgi:predicted PurR-regulated permease PerM
VALLLVVGLLVVLVVLLTALLNLATRNYGVLLAQYQPALQARTAELFTWLEAQGIETSGTARAYFNLEWVIRSLGIVAGTLGDVVATAFIVLVITVFMLVEAAALPAKVSHLPGLGDGALATLRQIGLDLRRYMVLKTMTSLLTGALVAGLLLLLGVDFVVTLGLLAFILNYVPVVGSLIASAPGIVLALLEFGFGSAVVTALGYLVINLGIHNAVEPRYMGHDLDLSPLVVLLSVLFWGWALGPIGMLLAVPLTVTIKVILESGEETRWLGLLLAARPPAEPPAT